MKVLIFLLTLISCICQGADQCQDKLKGQKAYCDILLDDYSALVKKIQGDHQETINILEQCGKDQLMWQKRALKTRSLLIKTIKRKKPKPKQITVDQLIENEMIHEALGEGL